MSLQKKTCILSIYCLQPKDEEKGIYIDSHISCESVCKVVYGVCFYYSEGI